ncbi:MAG: cell envelope integrity protein CreD [Candidatus Moranbacteria bacterium]|nr:cell envelope integrity protein CreD [Candidatus Moranbacteria bacterium]
MKNNKNNSLKLLIGGLLILVFLILANMVETMVKERQERKYEAIEEVGSKWGEDQILAGPVLTVPYKKNMGQNEKGEHIFQTDYINFLPNNLDIKGDVNSKILKRGIFEIVTYNSKLFFSGDFKNLNFEKYNIKKENVLADQAVISVFIPDMRGINETVKLKWNNRDFDFNPGIGDKEGNVIFNPKNRLYKFSGISTRVPLTLQDTDQSDDFYFELDLNGSKELSFLPFGKQTNVAVNSDWPYPSFDGAFLPDEREVNDSGFSANWKILQLNRGYPQSWKGALEDVDLVFNSIFKIKLLVGVDHYQKTMRSVKYAILFISLTFLFFFFMETINKIRIHPLQYVLVGLALVLFFTLLLSISEYISFGWAYLASTVATIGLIGFYSKSVLGKIKFSLMISLVLTLLYVFIYIILQMQETSLLIGSIGLFIILAAIMFFTRKVNWYSDSNSEKPKKSDK